MQESCHRCGAELPEGSGESPFCPHCGSPQLTLSLENQSAETGGEAAPGAIGAATTGTLPPPSPRQVEWKTAIRCAAAVAAIGALLCLGAMRVQVLSPVSLLWVMSASLITMGLYQRQRPTAWMDVNIGARIGVVVGLCLAQWGWARRWPAGGWWRALPCTPWAALTRRSRSWYRNRSSSPRRSGPGNELDSLGRRSSAPASCWPGSPWSPRSCWRCPRWVGRSPGCCGCVVVPRLSRTRSAGER